MIRILGRLFWNIVRTRLAGPEKANRPILVLVEDAEEPTQENIIKAVASSSKELIINIEDTAHFAERKLH